MAPCMLRMDANKKIPDVMELGSSSGSGSGGGSSGSGGKTDKNTEVEQTDLELDEPPLISTSLKYNIVPPKYQAAAINTAAGSLKKQIRSDVLPNTKIDVERTLRTNSDKTASVRPNNVSVATSTAAVKQQPSVSASASGDKVASKPSNSPASSSSKLSITIVPLSDDDPVVQRAYSLAKFIVDNVTLDTATKASGKVEETLLRNVTHLMTKHEILFRAMMRRLDINTDTGYLTFVSVANELFENQKRLVTWSRIIALYSFGAQLALYCKEKGFVEYAKNISMFMGKYVADMAGPFVKEHGGWDALVEEFPSDEELGDTVWKVLTWTAVGLGLATATMFFSSSH